jgi:hypothetical protein
MSSLRPSLQHPLVRFVVVEAAIFGIIGLLCLALKWDYSIALALAGAAIMALRIGSAPRTYDRNVGIYAYERQFIRDARDIGMIHRMQQFSSDLFVIGIVPLVAGIVLAFV